MPCLQRVYSMAVERWERQTDNKNINNEMIQDGRSLTSRDCSSQGRRRELEDATLSDKFWSLTEQEIPQWRKHTGGQHYSCGRCSGSTSTSARQLSEQCKQVRRTCMGPQQDTRARRSRCDGTSAPEHSAQSKQDQFPF
ncbi:uncharacterized protein LOC144576666 isoform X1 [Callithrix jacchus]